MSVPNEVLAKNSWRYQSLLEIELSEIQLLPKYLLKRLGFVTDL